VIPRMLAWTELGQQPAAKIHPTDCPLRLAQGLETAALRRGFRRQADPSPPKAREMILEQLGGQGFSICAAQHPVAAAALRTPFVGLGRRAGRPHRLSSTCSSSCCSANRLASSASCSRTHAPVLSAAESGRKRIQLIDCD